MLTDKSFIKMAITQPNKMLESDFWVMNDRTGEKNWIRDYFYEAVERKLEQCKIYISENYPEIF